MSSKIVLPTYSTILPSTGKPVQFRPFSVREEKSLLLALQEDSIDTLALTIKNLVSICTDGKVDTTTTPYYDVEYLFLQIRSKSIGEVVDMVGTCDCGPDKRTEFSLDIGDAVIEPAPSQKIVTITIPDTQYSIVMRHPSLDDFVRTINSNAEDAASVVANCISKVYTDEEVMDWTFEDKLDFVESMTTKQQREITSFLDAMPMVKLPASYKCRHCGKEHTNVMSGFENFFV